MQQIVIAGYGIAALTAADTLRDQGFTGRIVIVGAEQHQPYSRPALSKSAMTEEGTLTSHLLPPSEHGADQILDCRVTGIDATAKTLSLSDGSSLTYDGLIIATGIRPNRLSDRPDLEFTFRNIEDALALRELLKSKPSVVVIGGGVLGMELASASAAAGSKVTVVSRSKPLSKSLGDFLSELVVRTAEAKGVTFLQPQGKSVIESPEGNGQRRVILSDDSWVDADLVISAIGDVPNTEWLEGSGLLTDGELRIDSRCRVADGIVAAGDVTVFPIGGGLARLPLWTSAVEQAKVAAASLLKGDEAPELSFQPYFWTEQFGLAIKACGPLPVSGEPTAAEGDPATEPALLSWQSSDGNGTAVSVNYRIPIPKLRALSRVVPASENPAV
jgi:NADPH-dependent 2,4-dienoyl-CoA reductase/sulfur reductase-like enzyme